jgi:hypothetical protein
LADLRDGGFSCPPVLTGAIQLETFFSFLKVIPILIAAMVLGNWFIFEVKKKRKLQAPWYAPYLSIPGILIIIMILIPVLLRVFRG